MASIFSSFALLLCIKCVFCISCCVRSCDLMSCLFNGKYEFVDLTHAFDENTLYWPIMRNFTFTKKIAEFKEDGTWLAANDFAAGEHGGTHLDAPYHFNPTGAKVGSIKLEELILPMYIVDLSDEVGDNPNFVVYKHHLLRKMPAIDKEHESVLVVIKTGWCRYYYTNRAMYTGLQKDGKMNFPGLSGEAAEYIATSYPNVVGVGVDVASVDPGSSTDYYAHKNLTSAGLYILENVKFDRERKLPHECAALVLPMKIAQGTGAPVRLVAIVPKLRNESGFC